MEINRRQFICASVASPFFTGSVIAAGTPAFVLAGKDKDGGYYSVLLDQNARILRAVPLPGRAHGAAYCRQSNTLITFARRPDQFAVAYAVETTSPISVIQSAKGRHFYGHGAFSKDGKFLYAAENDFDNETGVIGIYDAQDRFNRLGEWPSGGIGPHEIRCSNDGKRLIIANGGILTHPDYPRQKLNLPDMRPSLTILDLPTGDLVKQVVLDPTLRQVSLRHFAEDHQGTIWIGGQYQGPLIDDVPLLFKLGKASSVLEPLILPRSLGQGIKHYIGSVAVSKQGSKVAFSAPKGNRVLIWNHQESSFETGYSESDICGLAPMGSGFLMSTGPGKLIHETTEQLPFQWDNHITAL
ncbi:DUF1513 domain-containing protein [Sneathiella aquimaris]|uniref:DUF1513 domain-containing protein n=1 Tax=Sneathiella aquimaris TaxID=2599305 RepID=UPI00146CC44E|nr:DUF1513 domain-containing protein [Sneathiella aquimaris]